MEENQWFLYWRFQLYLWIAIGFVGAIWVGIGGIFDLIKMYRKLKEAKRDLADDGRVEQNLN